MTQWGLDALFNPSKRHMDEEKARLQSTREQVGDSSGGKRIDLDSGRVRINRSTAEPAAPDTAAGELAGDDPADEPTPAEEPGPPSETAAGPGTGNPATDDSARDVDPASDPAVADSDSDVLGA